MPRPVNVPISTPTTLLCVEHPQHRVGNVARNKIKSGEDDEGNADENWHDLDQAPEDELEHGQIKRAKGGPDGG